MRIISLVCLLAIIILGVTFATLNSGEVTVNYYVGQRTMALSMLLVSVFSLGCLLGLLVGFWLLLKAKLKNYRLKKRLKVAEKEVQNLRAIPLKDRH